LTSRELGVHIDAIGLVPLTRALMLTVFAGPSLIAVRQSVITDVLISETYPYDTATFDSVDSEVANKTGVGFNAGADVTFQIRPNVGVGAKLRYLAGSVDLPSSVRDSVTYKVNAARFSAGIRLTF
jgi:hypothetical protein